MRRLARSTGFWTMATLCATAALAFGLGRIGPLQEIVFDTMIAPKNAALAALVVDIGAENERGAPWSRDDTARLATLLAKAQPKVVGFDMVFAGDCDSPAALHLSAALGGTPAIFGFLLSDNAQTAPPWPPSRLAITGRPVLWPAQGIDGPCPRFSTFEWALIALMGDSDAKVRHVPLGVSVGGRAYPGLAVAMAAQVRGGGAILGDDWLKLSGQPHMGVSNGHIRTPLSRPSVWPDRSYDAAALLSGAQSLPLGAIVIVGSSLPQRGGLRPSHVSPITPSVQIEADAVNAILAQNTPLRPVWGPILEGVFLAVAGAVGLILSQISRPSRALAFMAALTLFWAVGVLLGVHLAGLLLDPVLPGLALAALVLAGLSLRAITVARSERALRARMGQILPPSLVARLAAEPGLMRLSGETREVTALFTDIEGFSAATMSMGAQDMVATLEAYFATTCAIVLRHGGMIDKLVGDSIHALFNAPLDQPGHEAAALACAREIVAAAEIFCAAHNGFGRTRVGLETGPAILGDIGFGLRIDYTAHGPAVNLAARLQEVNKDFGTQICIGPCLGALAKDIGLVPLPETEVRSFGALRLYTLKV